MLQSVVSNRGEKHVKNARVQSKTNEDTGCHFGNQKTAGSSAKPEDHRYELHTAGMIGRGRRTQFPPQIIEVYKFWICSKNTGDKTHRVWGGRRAYLFFIISCNALTTPYFCRRKGASLWGLHKEAAAWRAEQNAFVYTKMKPTQTMCCCQWSDYTVLCTVSLSSHLHFHYLAVPSPC